jgi:hypothetical protein
VNYRFQATETFWENFYKLPPSQKESARRAWRIFKANPFDPRLGAHKIHKLSAVMDVTVYAVVIEGDLRTVFYLKDNRVITFNIGTHDIYKT